MDQAVVIANPAASQFTGGAHRDVMALMSRRFDVTAIWPVSGTDASVEAEKAATAGVKLVVAMGGDGMVHHVAQGLVDTDSSLGVIPVGTTNVIARVFGIPKSHTKAAKLLSGSAKATRVGTLQMDLKRGSVESTRYSIFACGLGLDADVVVAADKEPYKKYRFGSIHYATSAFRVAFGSFPKKKPQIAVVSGDREARVATIVFQFRNVYTYFGRLPITIDSDPPEPVSALLLERLRRYRVPIIASRIFAGSDLSKLSEVDVWSGVERVAATAGTPVALQADGESLGLVDAATFTWHPNSLGILTPQPPG